MITQGNFGSEFLERLPALEKEMLRHDLNPEDFIITKTQKSHNQIPITLVSDQYVITVNGQSFTVTMPNDIEFFKYFYGICFPPEEKAPSHPHRLTALLQRLEKWLAEDPLQKRQGG